MAAPSPVNINCKTTGSFNANGTATMDVIKTQTVALDTPHQTFNVAADPFVHFSLAEEASGSAVAQYTVSIVDKALLKTALGGWLKGGALNGAATPQAVSAYMIEYLRGEINALVATDGVGAALEAYVIDDLAFTQYDADAQGGADKLVDDLDGSPENKNLIGLQFPMSRYQETFSASLPAISGDSLTFQFTISSNILVSEDVKDIAPNATDNETPDVGTLLDVTKSRIVHIVATKA
jgi:hypothetical protein